MVIHDCSALFCGKKRRKATAKEEKKATVDTISFKREIKRKK
jgi:hypothetical protein